MDVFSFGVLAARKLRLDFERMSSKVISLRLQQVRWEILGSVSVIPGQGRVECWGGNAPQRAFAYDIPPPRLGFVDRFVEEVIEEEVFQVRILAVGGRYVFEEDRPDDTSSAPHERN